MRVRVLQGEREMARDNWELGNFDVAFTRMPKGQARVGVQFKIDENGILEVLARDVATGNDTVVKLGNAAVNVDDAPWKPWSANRWSTRSTTWRSAFSPRPGSRRRNSCPPSRRCLPKASPATTNAAKSRQPPPP
jgi:hypothetical protein